MADPLFGKKWQMDVSRSSFSTAAFSPASETRLYEETPGGYRLTVRGVNAGVEYKWGYDALYDGKPHPVHGRPDVDSITIYKLDDLNTCGFFWKQLMPGGPYARKLSADGARLQVQAAGRNAEGEAFFDVIEYEL